MSDKLEVPIWEDFEREAWRVFQRKFRTYKRKGGKVKARLLIDEGVQMLLALRCPGLDLDTASDEDVFATITQLWAPSTVVHAMDQLKRIRLTGPDMGAISKYCVAYLEEVNSFPDSVKPSGKQLVDIFHRQLKPMELRKLVAAQEFEEVDDAVAFTLDEAEGYQKYASEPQVAAAKPADKPKPDRAAGQPNFRGVQRAPKEGSASAPTGRPDNRVITCFNCGEPGHKSPACTKPRKEKPKNSIRKIEGDSSDGSTVVALPLVCNVMSKPLDGRRFSAKVFGEAQSGTVTAMFDTGADLNIIHPDVVAQFKQTGIVVINEPVQFQTAGGANEAKYQVSLYVEISHGMLMPVRIKTIFAVCDCGENMILGHPWLEEHGMTRLLWKGWEQSAGSHVVTSDDEFSAQEIPVVHVEEFWEDDDLHSVTRTMLARFPELFSALGKPAKVQPFSIEIENDADLPRAKPRRMAPEMRKEASRQTRELLAQGLIQPSTSAVASPLVMQKKKNGEYRMCVDYRAVNAVTKAMRLPLPNGKEILYRMEGSSYFARVDMRKGFHQIALTPESIPYTAFATPDGLYEYLCMPFGLKNPSGFFQATMERVLSGLSHCEVFVDDIVIHGSTKEEYLAALEAVLGRLQEYGFRLNEDKCSFGLRTVEYVGHIVSSDGITMSEDRKSAVMQIPVPKTVKQVRSFLGFANYFREFIPQMATLSKPLHELTRKGIKFSWTAEHQLAFEQVQQACASCTKLAFPTEEDELLMRTDASNLGVGAHLVQVSATGVETTVAFFSQAFNPTQQRWSTIEQEAYGIFAAIVHWNHFLWGRTFTVETDHRNLVYIHRCEAAKVIRWRLQLQEYTFVIRHISGSANVVADFLSRFPPASSESTPIPAVRMIEPLGVDASADADDGTASDVSEDIDLGFQLEAPPAVPTVAPGSVNVVTPGAPAGDPIFSPGMSLPEKFKAVHNSVVGHLGVDATIRRLAEQGTVAPGLRPQVQDLVASCAVCQKVRLGQGSVIAAVRTTAVQQPFQHIMWDTIGPLPVSSAGYEYVLVVMDRFTRFIELIPTHTVSSRDAAAALLQVCGRYGVFTTIHSDRGRQFDAAVVHHLCSLLSIEQTFGPPYRPQAQGMVERSNRETLRHLRAMLVSVSDVNAWADFLPLVQRIYNSLPNRGTGIAPARLLYGDAINLDRQLLLQVPEGTDTSTYDAYLVNLLEAQHKLVAASAAHQQRVVEQVLARSPDHPTSYEAGDLVLVLPAARQPRAKFQPRWLGPMAVVSRDVDTYQCQDLVTGTIKHLHVSRLKRYREDDTVAAADAALWDSEITLVDFIVAHQPGATKARWKFKIRWLDYGPEHDTWEPYRSVKLTSAFAQYIRAHQLGATFKFDEHPLDADG
jgi:transposase InsO family protein